MRLKGDAAACEATARELRDAGRLVDGGYAAVLQAQAVVDGWDGEAAREWSDAALRRSAAARDVAARLLSAAAALQQHACTLVDLQRRAARLTAEAAEVGLVLDHDGWIPPVHVPVGPLSSPEQAEERRRALHRREVRDTVVERARHVLLDAAHANVDVTRSLQRAAPRCLDVPTAGALDLAPTAADAPALVLKAAELSERLARFAGPLGTPVGIAVDVAHGVPVQEAVEKGVTVLVVGGLSGAVTVAALPSGPGSVAVGGVVSAAAGHVTGKVWDARHGRGGPRPPQPVRPAPPPAPARGHRGGRPADETVGPRPAPGRCPPAGSPRVRAAAPRHDPDQRPVAAAGPGGDAAG